MTVLECRSQLEAEFRKREKQTNNRVDGKQASCTGLQGKASGTVTLKQIQTIQTYELTNIILK